MERILGIIVKHFIILMIPLVKFWGKIKDPFLSHDLVMQKYYEIENILEPGDIINSVTSGEASNLINPGHWKHSILYIGKVKGIPMVMEAIGTGVTKRPLVLCMSTKSEIVILRCKPEVLPKEFIPKGIEWALKQEGVPYDYAFNMSADRGTQNFFCSEFCYDFVKAAYPETSLELRMKFGMQTFTPQDWADATKKVDHILEILKK